jgi:hypothetical protein
MKQYTMKQRHALLSEWKESGISISQFCKDKNLKVTTFHGWKKRYTQMRQPLVAVPLKQSIISTSASTIKLQWKSYSISIENDFDSAVLKKFLKVLESLHD